MKVFDCPDSIPLAGMGVQAPTGVSSSYVGL